MPIAALLWLPLALGAAEPLQENGGVAPLLEHQRLRQAMTRLASEHADLVSVLAVGLSRAERRVEALRLAAGELEAGRPAILVVANLDGPLVYTSGVALELARRLAQGYATDPRVRALLDTTTVYVVPRANPDAAQARFGTPLAEVWGTGSDTDRDRDGAAGEDGPGDVNGDGFVSVMRVLDPQGTWAADPTDPRVLVEAERAKGERGQWRLVPEGLDDDGDEEVGEDPAAGAEVNRNFAAGFEEHAARAGRYPTDEPESRGLVEFVLAHEDVQLVLVYGQLDNLVETPEGVDDDAPDVGRVPPPGLRASDAALIEELGRRYRDATGSKAAGTGDDAGTFQRWCYEHRGLLTLSARLFDVPIERPADEDAEDAPREEEPGEAPAPSEDARRLAWLETHGVADAHLGWQAFEHPTLGPVELGGFRPYALLEPPAQQRAALVDGQLEFLLGLGDVLARLALEEVTARDLGGGVIELKATVVNRGLLPLTTRWGARTDSVRPARVLLRSPQGATLLAGARQTLIDELGGLGGRRELTWIVTGAAPGALRVTVDSDHAGGAQAQPEVRQ